MTATVGFPGAAPVRAPRWLVWLAAAPTLLSAAVCLVVSALWHGLDAITLMVDSLPQTISGGSRTLVLIGAFRLLLNVLLVGVPAMTGFLILLWGRAAAPRRLGVMAVLTTAFALVWLSAGLAASFLI